MDKKYSDKRLIEELEQRFLNNKQSLTEQNELIKQLNIVNKKLEESEKLKTHFISNITNELINPFASILGLSRAILQTDRESWSKVKKMVHLIHTETFVLDFHFKNIFAAAKLEAGEIIPEIVNTNILLLFDKVVTDFQFEATKKNIILNLEFDVEIDKTEEVLFNTDSDKLSLIASNLICNSIKFIKDGNRVDIYVWKEEDNLIFSVSDDGEGIPFEQQQTIFDRFVRLDNNINSLNRGHGLGLSVTKALVELLEGTIELKSNEGVGTKFTISIPQHTKSYEGLSEYGDEVFFDSDDNGEVF